jgi:tRNA threonylcarbamoyladenosine biosynthesis protein TsaE
MDAQHHIEIVTRDLRETQHLGRLIGVHLQTGASIRLTGDLGSGKTCFVQGLAQGLAVPAGYEITSPTYTLVHEYPGRLALVHADLYRMVDELDAESIGLGEYFSVDTVLAVEWADRLADEYWPIPSLKICFHVQDTESRRLQLFAYGLQIVDLIKEVLAKWDAAARASSAR